MTVTNFGLISIEQLIRGFKELGYTINQETEGVGRFRTRRYPSPHERHGALPYFYHFLSIFKGEKRIGSVITMSDSAQPFAKGASHYLVTHRIKNLNAHPKLIRLFDQIPGFRSK